jgi:hypothetical protein
MTARKDTIESWVGDFCVSSAFVDHPSLVREYAPEVLVAFLEAACDARNVEPADLEEVDCKPGLFAGVGALEIPASVRTDVPALVAAFLEDLEGVGRLAGGRTLGLYVRALREPYLERAAGKGHTIRSPAAKVGRNDPCPCGSGKKYKKCCMGQLGG